MSEYFNPDELEFCIVIGRRKDGSAYIFAIGDFSDEKAAWCERFLSKAVDRRFDAIFDSLESDDDENEDEDNEEVANDGDDTDPEE